MSEFIDTLAPTINRDGRCDCDCSDLCPLGKMGMRYRCTKEELINAGVSFAEVISREKFSSRFAPKPTEGRYDSFDEWWDAYMSKRDPSGKSIYSSYTDRELSVARLFAMEAWKVAKKHYCRED